MANKYFIAAFVHDSAYKDDFHCASNNAYPKLHFSDGTRICAELRRILISCPLYNREMAHWHIICIGELFESLDDSAVLIHNWHITKMDPADYTKAMGDIYQ